jgi:hypothetical protein
VVVALVLTITTGRIEHERADAFQATFRTSLMRRFAEAPFLLQAVLVDLGDGEWQVQTLWDSTLAQHHTVDNDVPLTVRLFREFGAEPEIRLGDVSAFLQPPPRDRADLPGELTIAQRLDSTAPREDATTGGPTMDPHRYDLRVLEVDQTVPPRPEEEIADVRVDPGDTDSDPDPA